MKKKRKRKTEELHHPPLMFNHLNIRHGEAFKILPINFFASDYGVPPVHTHTLSLHTFLHAYIYHPPSATCPRTSKQTNRILSLSLHLFLTISALPFCLDIGIYRQLFITNFPRPSLSLSPFFFFFCLVQPKY